MQLQVILIGLVSPPCRSPNHKGSAKEEEKRVCWPLMLGVSINEESCPSSPASRSHVRPGAAPHSPQFFVAFFSDVFLCLQISGIPAQKGLGPIFPPTSFSMGLLSRHLRTGFSPHKSSKTRNVSLAS